MVSESPVSTPEQIPCDSTDIEGPTAVDFLEQVISGCQGRGEDKGVIVLMGQSFTFADEEF